MDYPNAGPKLPRTLTAKDWLLILLSLTILAGGFLYPAYRWLKVRLDFLNALTDPRVYSRVFNRPSHEALAWQRHLGARLNRPTLSREDGLIALLYACQTSPYCTQSAQAYQKLHPPTPFGLGYYYYVAVLFLSAIPLAFIRGLVTPTTTPPARGRLMGARDIERLTRTRQGRIPTYISRNLMPDSTFLGLLPEDNPRQILNKEPSRYTLLQLPSSVRERHVLVVAGTGAGKTTTYAYNQIASSARNGMGVILIDQKWGDPSGLIGAIPIFAYHRRPVYVFAPFSPDTMRLPLLEGIPTDSPTGAMELAQMVVPAADDASIQHYRENDWALLAALIIAEIEHARREQRPPDMGHIVELLSMESKENLERYTEISEIARILARKIFSRPSFKLDEAIPGLRNKLLPFLNPMVRRATTRGNPEENLDLDAILKQPALFYIGIPQTQVKMEDGKVLLRILKHYIDRAIFRQSRLQVPYNFILDEFANFGYLPNMAENLALIRSKRVAMHIILQSVEQAENVYGKEGWKAIATNNVNTEIWYVADLSPDVQLQLEERLGETVAFHESYAERRASPLDIIPNRTYGIRAGKEPLISSEEMSMAPPGTVVARLPNVGWTLYRAVPLFDPRNPFYREWNQALALAPHLAHASRTRLEGTPQAAPPKPKPVPPSPTQKLVGWLERLLDMGPPIRLYTDNKGRVNKVVIYYLEPASVPPEWLELKFLKPTPDGHTALDARALEAASHLLPRVEAADQLTRLLRTAYSRGLIRLLDENPDTTTVAYLDLPSHTLYVPPAVGDLYALAQEPKAVPSRLPEAPWKALKLGSLLHGLHAYLPDGRKEMALLYAESFNEREPITV